MAGVWMRRVMSCCVGLEELGGCSLMKETLCDAEARTADLGALSGEGIWE